MAKRRSATRRAVKRSAKRSMKRGAYKSRKNQMKSRGRTQRGGFSNLMSNISAGTALLSVCASIANIIPKIINGVFSLMVMVYILSAIARNPKAFAGAAKDDLKAKLEDLKKRMVDFVKVRPDLETCITTFETKIQTPQQPQSPPPLESNVGKTGIYSPGISTQQGPAKSYQALIVGEWDEVQAAENDYGQPMYLIWVKGGGLTPEIVSKDKIKFFSETEKDFTDLANNSIGQQQVTMEQARAHYELLPQDKNQPVASEISLPTPDQQETLIDILKQRAQEFSQAPNKRQFIIDAVNGYIAASKLRLERVTERFQDPDLKRCIQSIKEALTQQIKSQVAELKSKLSEISDSDQIRTVFDTITGLSQGLRDRFGAFTEKAKELQTTSNNLFNGAANKLPSFNSSFGSK